MKFDFYSDPGHGWLKVSLKLLRKLGIAERISGYSYQRNGFVYLEEDCDASLFVKVMEARGKTVEDVTHTTDRLSRIRSYAPYRVTPDPDAIKRVFACLKECFRSATPPLDLDLMPRFDPRKHERIDPNKHVITKKVFDELCVKHNVTIADSVYLFVNKFPKITGV